MKTTILAALAASLALVACGGDSTPTDAAGLTDAGYEKYDAQDYEGAQADFQAAIDAGAADASLKDATLGLVRALAHTNTEKAAETFTAFAAAHADQLVVKDYSTIGGELMGAGSAADALTVIHAGQQVFPDDEGLAKVVEAVMAKAAAGDAAAASALSGLGYL